MHLGETQRRPSRFGGEKNCIFPPGSEPRIVHPVASCYTVYATLNHKKNVMTDGINIYM